MNTKELVEKIEEMFNVVGCNCPTIRILTTYKNKKPKTRISLIDSHGNEMIEATSFSYPEDNQEELLSTLSNIIDNSVKGVYN